MFLKEVPQSLIETFAEGRLILFGGAGISVGSGLPTGRELAFQLQAELFKNKYVDRRPSPDDLFQLDQVAQRYQVAFGRQRLNETLLKVFQGEGLKPNDAHRLAVRLFPRILTTNFDSLFEDALKEEGRSPILVVRDIQLPTTSIPDRSVIYKLHGDIATPDRIVITQRDYARVPLNDGIRTELRSILLKTSVLFVGYGLGDPDFLRQVDFCRGLVEQQMPKCYAVILGSDKDQILIEQCTQDNIDVISDTAADFLSDFDQAITSHGTHASSLPFGPPPTGVSEDESNYAASICEQFKWIEFTGIPVPGGYLRVPIDQLFVSSSVVSHEELPTQPSRPNKPPRRRRRRTKSRLFKEVSEGRVLFEVLKEHPKVVILGDPGSGKTTLLRYIGYHLSLPDPQPAKVGLEQNYLPVFIPLRQYAASSRRAHKQSLQDFLPQLLKAQNLERYQDVIKDALSQGRGILLLDGLDEVASQQDREDIFNQVRQFAASCPACRFVLTSRKVGYPRAPIKDGFAHIVVQPFSDEQIQTFIDLWCRATGTESEKQNLIDAVSNPRVRVLAENPLLITILARVYKAFRNLPERRAKLYAKCVEALLTTWDLVRDLSPVFQDDREADRVMGPIALWIHRDCGGQFVSRDQLLSKLAEIGTLPRGQQPAVLLTQIEERSGLLREVGLNHYAFTHLTFQEYYVAREIVSRGDCFRQIRRFVKNDRWQEVISLTAGLLDDLGRKHLTQFLEHFIVERALPSRPTSLQIAKLNLLISCLKDKVEPDPRIIDYVAKSIMSLATRGGSRLWAIVQKLPQLAGFARTVVGRNLIEDLTRQIKASPASPTIANSVILGFNMFKEELERATFLLFAVGTVDPDKVLIGGAEYIARVASSAPDAVAREGLLRGIRALPLERRRKIVEPFAEVLAAGISEKTSEVWFSEEERSASAPGLRLRSQTSPMQGGIPKSVKK